MNLVDAVTGFIIGAVILGSGALLAIYMIKMVTVSIDRDWSNTKSLTIIFGPVALMLLAIFTIKYGTQV